MTMIRRVNGRRPSGAAWPSEAAGFAAGGSVSNRLLARRALPPIGGSPELLAACGGVKRSNRGTGYQPVFETSGDPTPSWSHNNEHGLAARATIDAAVRSNLF